MLNFINFSLDIAKLFKNKKIVYPVVVFLAILLACIVFIKFKESASIGQANKVANSTIQGSVIVQGSSNVKITQKVDSEINKQVYNGSVFDILQELGKAKTSLERDDLIKKYSNLEVKSTGYVLDIASKKSLYLVGETEDKTFEMLLKKDKEGSQNGITCFFDKEWEQALKALDISKEVEVLGTTGVDNLSFSSTFVLFDCEIITN